MYKIVIQTKDKPLQTQSLNINTINLKHDLINKEGLGTQKQVQVSPLAKIASHQQNYNEPKQNEKYKQQKLCGQLHLLRNLNTNINQLSIKLKSCIVLLFDIDGNIKNNKIVQRFIQQRQMEIQFLNIIQKQVMLDNGKKLGVCTFLIIIFKSLIIAQQFHNFINQHLIQDINSSHNKQDMIMTQKQNGPLLAVYIQNLTIIETDNGIGLQMWQKLVKDEQINKQVWAEIPHCLKCLQILQSSVTGLSIPHKQLNSPSKIVKSNTSSCKVCWIRQNQHSRCHKCQQIQDNWICMICGTIGCGRYKNADAYKHYVNSKHILSLDLQTDRVWNYKLDCFSHRVVAKEGIMIMEEGPSRNQINIDEIDDQEVQLEFWKYCNVVSEQLDRQRNFYNKIKQQQIERYTAEQKILQQKIKQLTALRQQKKQLIKKKIKKNKKLMKKCADLQQQLNQQKQLRTHLQEYVNQSSKLENKQVSGKSQLIQKQQNESITQKQFQSQAIKRKKQKLLELQKQIEEILINLS